VIKSQLTITWNFPRIGTGTSGDPYRNDPYTVKFAVQYKPDGGNWIDMGTTFATEAVVPDVVDGPYSARVAAIDFRGRQSSWVQFGSLVAASINCATVFNGGNTSVFLGAI